MLTRSKPEQSVLRTPQTPWTHATDLRTEDAPRAFSCEILVVGGGITGALLAEHLAGLGHDVVLLDRGVPGFGSTAASTAMLLWEIDAPLGKLADLHGWDRAADVYRRSFKAVEGLTSLLRSLGMPCRCRSRSTLYLTGGDMGFAALAQEHELRVRAGLPGELLDAATLSRHFALDRQGAIASPGSADVDPVCLTRRLLERAAAAGAGLWAGEAVDFQSRPDGATVRLSGGGEAEARHVILATGYSMPSIVPGGTHRISTSYALATEPQPPGSIWRDEALIWDAGARYSYARSTADGRLIFGGEDEEGHDAASAAAALPAKVATLLAKLKALWPPARLDLSASWAGAFGETTDGLPLIGRLPGHPNILAAYGYGGNGITFSYMASRILAAIIRGEERRWFESFAIDRAVPT